MHLYLPSLRWYQMNTDRSTLVNSLPRVAPDSTVAENQTHDLWTASPAPYHYASEARNHTVISIQQSPSTHMSFQRCLPVNHLHWLRQPNTVQPRENMEDRKNPKNKFGCGPSLCILVCGCHTTFVLIQSSSTDGASLPAQPVRTSVVLGSWPGGLERPS